MASSGKTTLPPSDFDGTDPVTAAERYTHVREIGAGASAVVYAALDTHLGREVALKVLKDARYSQPRFEREARLTAYLQHPSIVPVYDIGLRPDGAPYYSMPRLRGTSLADALADADDLTARLALLPHVLRAAHAVASAHDAGVIHRDLKPANVMVGDLGETHVVDWGLARWIGQADSLSDRTLATLLQGELDSPARTSAGAVLGTPAYMSPEQARGEDVGPPSDVFALGCLLYEVLTGTRPYRGEDVVAVLARAAAGAWLPVATVERGAPRPLASIVARAMAPDPADRYGSARALAADLEAWFGGTPVAAHRYAPGERLVQWLGRARVPMAFALAGAAVLLVAGGFALREAQQARDALRVAGSRTAATSASRAARSGDVVRAGHLAADALDLDPTNTEARGALAATWAVPRPRLRATLPLPVPCSHLRVRPQGVLCSGPEGTVLVDPESGAVRHRWDHRGHGLANAPDGRVMLVNARTPALLDLDDGSTAPLPELHRLAGAAVGPDGAVTAIAGATLTRFDPPHPPRTQALGGATRSTAIAGGPHRLAVSHGPEILLLDPLSWEQRGAVPGHAVTLAWSVDGTRLAAANLRSEVRVHSLDGLTRVHDDHDDYVWALAWGDELLATADPHAVHLRAPPSFRTVHRVSAPAGHAIAAVGIGPGRLYAGAGRTLLCWDLPTAERPHVLHHDQGASALEVSPSGEVLAVASPQGGVSVFRVLDGTLLWRGLADAEPYDLAFLDDDRLAIAANSEPADVRRLDLATGEATRTDGPGKLLRRLEAVRGTLIAGAYGGTLLTTTEGDDAWHASGKSIGDVDAGPGQVWAAVTPSGVKVVPPDGDAVTVPVEGATQAIAVSGRWLVVNPEKGPIDLYDWTTGARVARAPIEPIVADLAISPDGRRLVAGLWDHSVRAWSIPDLTPRMVGRIHTHAAARVAFAGDDVLWTASWDGTVRRWDLSALDATPARARETYAP